MRYAPCLIAILAVLLAAPPAPARSFRGEIVVCPTVVHINYVDYLATSALFARYGPAWEGNPLVRQVGPDAYFAAFMVGGMATCRQTRAWQGVALVSWAVQTWAVNTHLQVGTARQMPLLFFRIGW